MGGSVQVKWITTCVLVVGSGAFAGQEHSTASNRPGIHVSRLRLSGMAQQ